MKGLKSKLKVRFKYHNFIKFNIFIDFAYCLISIKLLVIQFCCDVKASKSPFVQLK